MNLIKLIKNNLFIQNFVANIVSLVSPYLEFSIAKYLAIKKAMYISAHDDTYGNYFEFGIFKGSKNKGEYSAFADFRKKYPETLFRKIFDYGYGSRAFIAYKTN